MESEFDASESAVALAHLVGENILMRDLEQENNIWRVSALSEEPKVHKLAEANREITADMLKKGRTE